MGDFDGVESSTYRVAPAGWYNMQYAGDEIKTAKSGSKYLEIKFKIADGDFRGVVVFHNLNLWNSNDKATLIAKQQYMALFESCGLPVAMDTGVLLGKTLSIKLDVEVSSDYGDKNVAKAFKAVTTASGVAASPQTTARTVPPPVARPIGGAVPPARQVPPARPAVATPPAGTPAAPAISDDQFEDDLPF